MPKHFIKIITAPLIALIFLLGSNFCWQNVLDPVIFTGVTSVPTFIPIVIGYNNDNNSAIETDSCNEERNNVSSTNFLISSSATSHHNAILPCCLNDGQPNAVAFTQSLEINKAAPATLFVGEQLFKIIPEINSYHIPIIAPPELLAVQTTVLRL